MTTAELRTHFISQAPWVDPDSTVDTVKAGDPHRQIHKAGVGWMATIFDLQAAHAAGCDLFITHEPTFFGHRDVHEKRGAQVEPGRTKRRFLEQTGMVVLRLHDTWDAWPKIGIRDSWARGLGLTDFIAENHSGPQARWHAVYRIEETTLGEFARTVAARVRCLGQDGVDMMGDPEMRVSRPALGVGCGGPDVDMIEHGADVLIVCYDGASYWATRERFIELGVGVIVVEHGTSEMWGMQSLARYLRQTFPGLDVVDSAEHPRVRHVASE